MQNALNLRDILYLAWKNLQTSERTILCYCSFFSITRPGWYVL